MRGFVKMLVVVLILGGLFPYVVLPGLIEDQLAGRLQGSLGAPTPPEVDVSSNFPPELLLGRIDRIQVSAGQMSLQGAAFYNARVDLRDVKVSIPSLLEGAPAIETSSCSLSAEAPALYIGQNQACLGALGLGPV